MLGDHSTHRARGQLPNPPRAGAATSIPGKRLLQGLCPCFNDVFEVSWTSCCSVTKRGIACLVQFVSWKAQSRISRLLMDNMKLGFFPPSLTTQSCPSPRCCLPISWLTGGRKAPWQLATLNPPSPDLLSPKPAADVGRARALLPIRASHAEIPALFAWH